jgi:glucokinase
MTRLVLAGDIGGTKTDLALYAADDPARLSVVREQVFPSRQYGGLEEVLRAFLDRGERGERIEAAAFGIAGPVVDETVVTTNLPWTVAAASLRRMLGTDHVRLANDLEAMAFGALFLPPASLLALNAGVERPGNRAVIAAGTGLGQGLLFWDGARHRPMATEGGHVDFAPRDDTEVALLQNLRRRYGHVSYERVLSGPGLVNVFEFLTSERGMPVAETVRARLATEDPSAVIGTAGLAGTCAAAVEALRIFVDVYGAQAGNLALATMAIGGIYVGGGIVTKILPAIQDGTFMRAFTDKGRYADLLAEIPVRLILDPLTGRIGAAHAAAALLASG